MLILLTRVRGSSKRLQLLWGVSLMAIHCQALRQNHAQLELARCRHLRHAEGWDLSCPSIWGWQAKVGMPNLMTWVCVWYSSCMHAHHLWMALIQVIAAESGWMIGMKSTSSGFFNVVCFIMCNTNARAAECRRRTNGERPKYINLIDNAFSQFCVGDKFWCRPLTGTSLQHTAINWVRSKPAAITSFVKPWVWSARYDPCNPDKRMADQSKRLIEYGIHMRTLINRVQCWI